LRLESDADLVQVITIHKSKGLQYPLVFLPFVSGFRKEDEARGGDDAARLAEDIRLLYVAMTRAERALWLGLAPFKGDLDGKTPRARSAVSEVLQRQRPDDLVERLQRWAACSDILVAAAPEPDLARYLPPTSVAQWKPALQPTRRLQSRWWSASFSALTRVLAPPSASAASAQPGSERDDRIDDALVDSALSAQ
jgi:exodeoxyribonuclease V beta subunit